MTRLKKMGLTLTLLLSLGGLLSFINNTNEYPPGKWEKLGIRKVNMTADHDVIMVTASKGFFTKLKFRVLKAPLFVKNVRVIFGNGTDKNITLNKVFAAGTETKIIDLSGNKRIIKQINFNYKTPRTGNGRSIVVAWGKH
jgi:hypothetical protein